MIEFDLQLGAMDGMQGQPMIGKMKMFFRGFAVLIVPLTATFPKVSCQGCYHVVGATESFKFCCLFDT
jgi:hypothetical protein